MPQLANSSIQLRFKPNRHWYLLSSGWAIIAGLISTSEFLFTIENLIYMALLWFLVDPLLGTVGDLWVQRNQWHYDDDTEVPSNTSTLMSLPYLAKHSPASRLNKHLLALVNAPYGEGYTVLLGGILAVGLSLLFGPLVVGYIALSLILTLLLAGEKPLLLQVALSFVVPFMIGRLIFSPLSLAAVLMTLIFSFVFYGVLQLKLGQLYGTYFVRGGLVAATCLTFSLYRPILGLCLLMATLFCQLLYLYLGNLDNRPAVSRQYINQTGLFVLFSLFIATIALR